MLQRPACAGLVALARGCLPPQLRLDNEAGLDVFLLGQRKQLSALDG